MSKEKKRVLGRGLSALLSESGEKANSVSDSGAKELVGNIVNIPIERIVANPNQPRTNFDPKTLAELSQSIKAVSYTHLTLPTICSV